MTDSARWQAFTPFEQMGNIGSEISRATHWQGKDQKLFDGAVDRALELFDLTLGDPRWRGARLFELARAREVFCDAVLGGKEYSSTLAGLMPYFDQFALAARRGI